VVFVEFGNVTWKKSINTSCFFVFVCLFVCFNFVMFCNSFFSSVSTFMKSYRSSVRLMKWKAGLQRHQRIIFPGKCTSLWEKEIVVIDYRHDRDHPDSVKLWHLSWNFSWKKNPLHFMKIHELFHDISWIFINLSFMKFHDFMKFHEIQFRQGKVIK
jgi:hypothetical protein